MHQAMFNRLGQNSIMRAQWSFTSRRRCIAVRMLQWLIVLHLTPMMLQRCFIGLEQSRPLAMPP